jgi:hypothetical protein
LNRCLRIGVMGFHGTVEMTAVTDVAEHAEVCSGYVTMVTDSFQFVI